MLEVETSQETWLSWLEQRCQHQPIQLGLDRVKQVAEHLQLLQVDAPVIIVGGTNGKGSTVRSLEVIYQQAGYRVAVYTSPHLLSFNERISVNQHPISENDLCEAFRVIFKAEQGCTLTYFEFTTLAALWHFKQAQPDLIILEVGLGGRLDATNIVDADLAILTTIDYDHQAYLGETLEAIGAEKAGIFRPHQLAIFAAARPPASVLNKVETLQTQLHRYQQDYNYELTASYRFVSPGFEWTCGRPLLHPEALSAAIMGSRLLMERLPIPVSAYEGLERVNLPGRLQSIPGKIDLLVDVAHNLQSVKRLSDFLKQKYKGKSIHAVFSALSDKPIAEMMRCLALQVDCWHIAPLGVSRAASVDQLLGASAHSQCEAVLWYNSLDLAFEGAKASAKANDLLIAFGSFYTVGKLLAYLGETHDCR